MQNFNEQKIVLPNININQDFEEIPLMIGGAMHMNAAKSSISVFLSGGNITSIPELLTHSTMTIDQLICIIKTNRYFQKFEIRMPIDQLTGIPDCEKLVLNKCYNLTHLKDIHKYFKSLIIQLEFNDTLLKSNILGLVKCNISEMIINFANSSSTNDFVRFVSAMNIVNNHIRNGRDMLDCQEELITNKLKEYAKL